MEFLNTPAALLFVIFMGTLGICHELRRIVDSLNDLVRIEHGRDFRDLNGDNDEA